MYGRRRRADPIRGQQRGLHLAELDPEAAQLHLVVGAAEVFDAAVTDQRDVAGLVHAVARAAEGVGDEPGGGQFVPVGIAAGELPTGQVQVPGHPVGCLDEP